MARRFVPTFSATFAQCKQDTAVWDLLKQKWLDELHLILQDDEVEERDSVIEVYKIRFGYNFDGSANVELASRDRTAIVTPGRSALHLKHSMAQIITETAELCKQSTLKGKHHYRDRL